MTRVPPCLGFYDPKDTTCNGDPNGADDHARAVCSWRDRCGALRVHAGVIGAPVQQIVAEKSPEALSTLCTEAVTKYAVVNGLPILPSAPPPASKSEPPKDQRPTRERDRTRAKVKAPQSRYSRGGTPRSALKPELIALHQHFETTLRDLFRERRFGSGKRVLVYPGTFYAVDRSTVSHYVAWYCTSKTNHDIALARCKFKPRTMTMDVHLPISLDELQKFLGVRTFKKLNARSIDDGQYKVCCSNLDREGIAVCAQTLRGMVDSDILILPDAGKKARK